MLKKITKNLLLTTIIITSTGYQLTQSALAAQAVNSKSNENSNFKVAVIDIQSIILQTDEGKKARVDLEKEILKKREVLTKSHEALQKLQKDYQQQQAVLTNEDKQKKQREITQKFQTLQQDQITSEQQAKQQEAQALQKIFTKIQSISQVIAKEQGFDFVFDRGAAVVIYAKNAVDITAEVISAYNKIYKVPESKDTQKEIKK